MAPPATEGWIHELLLPGTRTICKIENNRTHLFYGANKLKNTSIISLHQWANDFACQGVYVDGVIFKWKYHATRMLESFILPQGKGLDHTWYYFVFDMMFMNGRDIRQEPLVHRKSYLRNWLGAWRSGPFVFMIDFSDGKALSKQSKILGLDGIVSKRMSSTYQDGFHTQEWLITRNDRTPKTADV